jgi:formyltetrahydrofolate-dependent phosphoribosylglycinamide formyltransferase
MPVPPINLAVLVSGSGTTLQNLIDRIGERSLDARIKLVIASKPGLVAQQRAADAELPSAVVNRKGFEDVQAFSRRVFLLCDQAQVDLVCLAGWLCLLDIPARYEHKVMNIHPALLPAFGGRGMYGQRVHQAVLDHGCKVSGCTVHFVDNTYDNGPIILQKTCDVRDDDAPQTLAKRVFELETSAYPEAIRLFQRGALSVDGRRVRVNALREPGQA